jgi:hypothetical protein
MSNFDLQFNEQNKDDLLVAAKWAKILAIFGYVGMGFMIFGALSMLVMGNTMEGAMPGIPTNAVALLYLLLAAFYYMPVTYMYKMSKNLKEAILNSTQTNFDLGINYLSKFFKFSGYMVVGIIVLYIVIIIGAMIMALVSGLG